MLLNKPRCTFEALVLSLLSVVLVVMLGLGFFAAAILRGEKLVWVFLLSDRKSLFLLGY